MRSVDDELELLRLSRAYLERVVWRFRVELRRGALRLIKRFGAP